MCLSVQNAIVGVYDVMQMNEGELADQSDQKEDESECMHVHS